MKIITKIASLTLLTLCLQVDASTYTPGAAGFATACQYLVSNNQLNNPSVKRGFSQFYGIDAVTCSDNAGSAAVAIQAFIDTNFNPATRQFGTPKLAQDFATLVGTKSYLFTGNVFPHIDGQTYYQIATAQIENEVTTQTATAATQAAALTTIATSVATLRGTAAPLPGAPVNLPQLTKSITRIDTQEKEARDYLNGLLVKWIAATNTFDYTPLTAANLGARNIEKLIKTTFANRLQYLFPVANPTFASIIPLIEDRTILSINFLSPVTTTNPINYDGTEFEANSIIKAMVDQISLTNTELDGVAGVAGPIPAGPLSAKATYILTHMKGAVVTAKGAISTALNGVMALAGYAPAVPVPAPVVLGAPVVPPAPPVIDEVALATAAAAAITATEAALVATAGAPINHAFAPASTTLQARATELLTEMKRQIVASNVATVQITTNLTPAAALSGYAIPAAVGTAVPVIDLPAFSKAAADEIVATDALFAAKDPLLTAGTLQARATLLLGKLSVGGGSAGIITAYLAPKLGDTLYTQLAAVVTKARADTGYAVADKTNIKKQLTGIIAGLNADATYSTALTAEDKVKAAIAYFTTELYLSYMWLKMEKEPLTFAAVPNLPVYASGDSQNVAAAAQNRITALIGAIKALNTQNAALVIAATAARAAGGAAGAEGDPSVMAVTAEIEKLARQLTPCATVVAGANAAAKLLLLNPAVAQMANALTVLSAGATGLPAADGATLAAAIKAQIEASNTTALSVTINTNVEAVNATLSGFITLPALPATMKLTALGTNAQTLVNIIQTLAHNAGIKDALGTAAIPAAGAPLVLAAGAKLDPATLAGAIEAGIKATVPVSPAVAELVTAKAEVARLETELTAATLAGAGVGKLTTDLAAAEANVARLTPLLATTQADVATERASLAALPGLIAADLISDNGGTRFGTSTYVGNPNPLTGLTANALTAASNLTDVGNYLRQCAEAAFALKSLAGIPLPADMPSLLNDSIIAIRGKIAAAPAPAAGPAVSLPADLQTIAQLRQQLAAAAPAAAGAAAAIPQLAIDGHNASVVFVCSEFNKAAVATKRLAKFQTIIPALNAAATVLGGNAQTITITTPGVVGAVNITDKPSRDAMVMAVTPTVANATNSTWATAA